MYDFVEVGRGGQVDERGLVGHECCFVTPFSEYLEKRRAVAGTPQRLINDAEIRRRRKAPVEQRAFSSELIERRCRISRVAVSAESRRTQTIDDIRGLVTVSPTVGWGLMAGTLAILGMPPFGVFASEFLILTTAMRQEPWSTPILLLALGIAFAAVFRRVQPMVFGETTAKRLPHSPALLPVFAHLALVLLLGVYIPPYLADWYRAAADLIAGL